MTSMKFDNIKNELEDLLDYQFHDSHLLQLALTHRSYTHESSKNHEYSYERLEFLGDAVLELIISHHLWERFPKATEGELTRLRASLVKKASLALVAKDLQLGQFIFLGRGEILACGYERPSILADVVEALLGAIYIDGGFEKAQKVCLHVMRNRLETLDPMQSYNYKNQLQEFLAKIGLPRPEYSLLKQEGPAHRPTFYMKGVIGDLYEAVGIGHNKKAATQNTAKNLLEQLELSLVEQSIEN